MSTSGQNSKLNNGLELFGSRIFQKITAGVFASILIIEMVLLAYSWFTERERQLARLDDAMANVVVILDVDNPSIQLEKLMIEGSVAGHYPLIGYQYQGHDGVIFEGGSVAALKSAVSADNPRRFDSSTGEYARYVKNAAGQTFWLCVDASWINAYMRTYVWRILGMVMLISLFVTLASLVILKPILISPLQRLHQLLVRGQKHGISNATPEVRDLNRSDELGSVFQSLELLRNRVLSSEQEATRLSSRFEGFANLGADCFWEVDQRMRFTYVAGDTARLFGMEPATFLNQNLPHVLKRLDGQLLGGDALRAELREHGTWEGATCRKTDTDCQNSVSVRVVSSALYDNEDKLIGFRGTIADISKETALAEELRYQATHDELTGLCNRRELTYRLQLAISNYEKKGVEFSLISMDLDRFKTINDSCGHTAGDMLLKGLAKRLLNMVGERDTVARLGGDEFAILLTDASAEPTQQMAEDIRRMIDEHRFQWENEIHIISASIGVVQATPDMFSQEELIFAADSCLLKAKRSGKNQVQTYSEDDTSFNLFRDEAQWISRITRALENDEFSLFRQTIQPIASNQPEDHFEILIRMKNPEGGFWPPYLFLGCAERNELMQKIDRWVVTNSISWLRQQDLHDELPLCMNINLSGASLSDSGFREFLISTVEQNKDYSKHICFEMTETAAMMSYNETIALLNQLRELGCLVALDDFGTGFSSLAHIRDIPLDYIKIDGVFIRDICKGELDQTLVRSVADIARVLGIKTVAEFVEDSDTVELLQSMGIDYAQGYYFAEPVALDNDDAQNVAKAA